MIGDTFPASLRETLQNILVHGTEADRQAAVVCRVFPGDIQDRNERLSAIHYLSGRVPMHRRGFIAATAGAFFSITRSSAQTISSFTERIYAITPANERELLGLLDAD
jgi:limonene-1,2-epoxide hydrolase